MAIGKAPTPLGIIELECPEMLFIQYMPLCLAGKWGVEIPDNLTWALPLVAQAITDSQAGLDHYTYITAKHFYVEAGDYQNRPNWHIDGFGTEDINYIWYDSVPTEFCVQPFTLSGCHRESIRQMQEQALEENIVTYPVNTFLRLDNGVVHRVSTSKVGGYRTFVKISVSKHKYNLKGNAHNYLLDYRWSMQERSSERNCPTAL